MSGRGNSPRAVFKSLTSNSGAAFLPPSDLETERAVRGIICVADKFGAAELPGLAAL